VDTTEFSEQQYRQDQETVFDYLCVDSFMKTVVDARALATAFELRLIDYLSENQASTLDDLKKGFAGDDQGLKFLLNLLRANRVIEENKGTVSLSPEFQQALHYRDLLEAKLEFAQFVLPDFKDLFSSLIASPDQFGPNSRTFELFCYQRSFEYSPENYELTKRWVRITTALTRYEAQVCMKYHDFGRYRRILDIGGNSGEFVLRICKNYPNIHATVLDLPLVCQVGLEHLRSEPEAERISFIKGNALADELPKDFDLISFKSMLHDWPENEAKQFITKASQSLQPGGTLLIFERGPIEVNETPLPYSMIPFLLFFRSFRSPAVYKEQLETLGFQDIGIQRIDLEMPFYLVTAKKR
jgi:ubiquinone/menaquinone biosynthesis C-methylase UbiE